MENRAQNTFTVLFALLVALAVTDSSTPDQIAPGPMSTSSAVPVNPPAVNAPPAAATVAPVVPVKIAAAPDLTKPVQVQLFYEALCKDSVDFVEDQLLPAFEKLGKFIDITYNPFSQGTITTQNDSTIYTCPRGKEECDADRVHACAIAHISNPLSLLKFVNCSLVEGFKNKTVPIEACGKNSSIDADTVSKISTCFSGNEGYSYLSSYKDKAVAANVSSVPKIIINKVYSNETQNLAQSNFKKVVCQHIPVENQPSECKDIDSGSSTVVVGVLPMLVGVYYIIKMF